MKRIAYLTVCWISLFLIAAGWLCGQSAPTREPVYIFVNTSVGDYVNWPISEERLQRTLALIEK